MKDILNKPKDSGPPGLTKLLYNWIENDPVLDKHFKLFEYGEHRVAAPVPSGTGLVVFKCLGLSPPYPAHIYICKIYEDKADVMFGHNAAYRFDIRYPLFFNKLRAHLLDVHNKHWASCGTHLY